MDSFLPELWAAAKTAGPFGTLILLFILYFVNKEREIHRDARIQFLSELINALNETTATNKAFAETMDDNNKVFNAIEKAIVIQTGEVRKLAKRLDKA